jgi:hypothetical protein
LFLSFCPSIRSIGAYKANITRKRWNQWSVKIHS